MAVIPCHSIIVSIAIENLVLNDMKLKNLNPDKRNANKGTVRGQKQIIGSIQRNGFGRSGLLDKNGSIIAGNKTTEAAAEVFGVDVEPIIVETDGNRPVYVKRSDLNLDDPNPNNPARRLAYEDNLASKFSFDLDIDVVMSDIEAGLDLGDMGVTLRDISQMLSEAANDVDDKSHNIQSQFMIVIECSSEKEQVTLFDEFQERGVKCRLLVS